MVHTARADNREFARTEEPRALAVVAAPCESEHTALREWCETRAHPPGRLADGECLCGLIRYDD
jgi:hypothetical protein